MTISRLYNLALVSSLVVMVSSATALACAVATTVLVENHAAVPMMALWVSAPDTGPNQLDFRLEPGQSVRINLPSCLGIYELSATFSDGRTVTHGELDAQNIRGVQMR
jgi:hypothetical protein